VALAAAAQVSGCLRRLAAAPRHQHLACRSARRAAAEQLDLDRALAKLTHTERLCVVLAYSEGLSHGEISAAAALPLGTVKSHVRRGAQRLRVLLRAYEPAEKEHAHVG
jgi:RNA polymerase sigma-70 factor (ECF subfamily)